MPTTGRVKWFDPKKGFGFIIGPNEQDVFVHFSQISGDGFRSLKDGEEVEYELVEGDKGLQAREVRRLGSSSPPSDESDKSDKSDEAGESAETDGLPESPVDDGGI